LATKWGQPVETITKPPFPSIWVDSTTKPGEVQEYKIAAALPHSSKTAYGFVTGGIRVPPIHHRGRALLIIDQGVEASLSQELVRFQHDLAGDGWTVVPHSVPSEAPGPCVTEIFKYEPGNLAGTYRYVVTFLSDRSESEPSPPSGPINRWKLRASLSYIRTGPVGTTGRRIYRAQGTNNFTFRLVGTINDNTTTGFVDNVAENELGPVLQKKYQSRVKELRSWIWSEYGKASNEVHSIILFGHVPVPYSGNATSSHDNHYSSPAHYGTWPADMYYSSSQAVEWLDQRTDSTVQLYYSWNFNYPGDGKFDFDFLPAGSYIFPVGRIDLRDMPVFSPETETSLLKKYLTKDHEFRHGIKEYPRRALYDYANGRLRFGEAGMLRTMATFFKEYPKTGTGIVVPTLRSEKYMWANIYGSAEFKQIYFAIQTADFRAPMKAPFYSMYGSFFGDWDNPDNLLRAPLGGSDGLVNMWYGPVNGICHGMALHPMACGETVGEVLRRAQSQPQLYLDLFGDAPHPGFSSLYATIMGDPTLRMHNLAPPSNLRTYERSAGTLALEWDPSKAEGTFGPGEGYFLYRSASMLGPFSAINSEPIRDHKFTKDIDPDRHFYIVRLCKLESNTGGGSYYNLSQAADYSLYLSLAGLEKNNNQPSLIITGPPGLSCQIDRSLDRKQWTSVGNVKLNGKGAATYQIPNYPAFFRGRGAPTKGNQPYIFSENELQYSGSR
jgi:hypothetical protein